MNDDDMRRQFGEHRGTGGEVTVAEAAKPFTPAERDRLRELCEASWLDEFGREMRIAVPRLLAALVAAEAERLKWQNACLETDSKGRKAVEQAWAERDALQAELAEAAEACGNHRRERAATETRANAAEAENARLVEQLAEAKARGDQCQRDATAAKLQLDNRGVDVGGVPQSIHDYADEIGREKVVAEARRKALEEAAGIIDRSKAQPSTHAARKLLVMLAAHLRRLAQQAPDAQPDESATLLAALDRDPARKAQYIRRHGTSGYVDLARRARNAQPDKEPRA